ncbi:hypothetical protein BC826DRAFT_659719 [Russula brevipes]|nr:hypothetical protein BC826DRAFT_659719 [Russula brevipes]
MHVLYIYYPSTSTIQSRSSNERLASGSSAISCSGVTSRDCKSAVTKSLMSSGTIAPDATSRVSKGSWRAWRRVSISSSRPTLGPSQELASQTVNQCDDPRNWAATLRKRPRLCISSSTGPPASSRPNPGTLPKNLPRRRWISAMILGIGPPPCASSSPSRV